MGWSPRHICGNANGIHIDSCVASREAAAANIDQPADSVESK